MNNNDKYLILYRNDYILQLEAWFRLAQSNNIKKFVKDNKNILYIEYYELVRNPIVNYTKIINFFNDNKFETHHIKKCLDRRFEKIYIRHNLQNGIYNKIKSQIEK